jgi:hypothetical protein
LKILIKLLCFSPIILWFAQRAIVRLPVFPELSFFLDFYEGPIFLLGLLMAVFVIWLYRTPMSLIMLTLFFLSLLGWDPLPERVVAATNQPETSVLATCPASVHARAVSESHLPAPWLPSFILAPTGCVSLKAQGYSELTCAHAMSLFSRPATHAATYVSSSDNFCAAAFADANGTARTVLFISFESQLSAMTRQTNFWRELRKFAGLLRHQEVGQSAFYFIAREPISSPNIFGIGKISKRMLILDMSWSEIASEILLPRFGDELRVYEYR